MIGATVPLELWPKLRLVNHLILYETWVVASDQVAEVEQMGFEMVPAKQLSDDERTRYARERKGVRAKRAKEVRAERQAQTSASANKRERSGKRKEARAQTSASDASARKEGAAAARSL